MGPSVCRSLWDFEFNYQDVDVTAHNTAKDLTDEAVVLLAKNCPKLRRVQLQGTERLTDNAIAAFFQYCPNLSVLEVTPRSQFSLHLEGTAFELLLEEPDLAMKLKKLRLGEGENQNFLKRMRALGKERPKLLIQLVHVSEDKEWGDWVLSVGSVDYRNGRKVWR